jgi:hypothetical protein
MKYRNILTKVQLASIEGATVSLYREKLLLPMAAANNTDREIRVAALQI